MCVGVPGDPLVGREKRAKPDKGMCLAKFICLKVNANVCLISQFLEKKKEPNFFPFNN